jgi:exopolysaccharide biosynthesis polyprenyl glycosylphosphotransferase
MGGIKMEPQVSYELLQKKLTETEYDKGIVYEFIKRTIDIIGSLSGIILLSPLLLITAIIIKLDSKGPAFFKQNRCGKDGNLFKMYKFRSMTADAEDELKDLKDKNEMTGPVFKIHDDPRITKFGKFIRRTSIDELPQLFNVLKGEMSLVGPRPPIDREVTYYTPYQIQRLLVKPGLTCYWQTMGRNNIDFDRWVDLDIKYIKERNTWIDIKLIFKTIFVLFGDKNAC